MDKKPGVEGMLMEYTVTPTLMSLEIDREFDFLFGTTSLVKGKSYTFRFIHSQIDKERAFTRFEKIYGSKCKINKTIRDIEATTSGA